MWGDLLCGTPENDTFFGLAWDDRVFAAGGDNRVDAGCDDDTLRGELGGDFLIGDLLTPTGTDRGGADRLFRRPNASSCAAADRQKDARPPCPRSPSAERLRHALTAGGDTMLSWLDERFMAVIRGTAAGDTLRGTQAAGDIFGLAGYDTIHGANGDEIWGGAGDHRLYGEGGDLDTLIGGTGNDRVFGGRAYNRLYDTADGPDGDDYHDGGAGEDTLIYRDQTVGVHLRLAADAAGLSRAVQGGEVVVTRAGPSSRHGRLMPLAVDELLSLCWKPAALKNRAAPAASARSQFILFLPDREPARLPTCRRPVSAR